MPQGHSAWLVFEVRIGNPRLARVLRDVRSITSFGLAAPANSNRARVSCPGDQSIFTWIRRMGMCARGIRDGQGEGA